DDPGVSVERMLRPVRSEMGQVDAAAAWEALRRRRFRYEVDNACLVELDEEPPHGMNPEAVEICLVCALLLGSTPVDEIEVMRKIVVDGSNTAGFQRTALVALGGSVSTPHGDVRIQTICLEEDSARKIDDSGGLVTYRLDRLGIPLIEIATAPDIDSPEMVQATAARIGSILRATGRVKRGLGTVRQDLNVSLPGGSRVEIKGVQDLRSIGRTVEREVERQRHLIWLSRQVTGEIEPSPVDVSEAFSSTGSGLVRKGLDRGQVVLGQRLPGFAGLISAGDEHRLGRELAAHARSMGASGLLHSDELPAYGISNDEVWEVRRLLGCREGDAFILVLDREERARRALDAAVRRAAAVPDGVPSEVRRALPDCTTEYLRPMPGSARMYPETDVPPVCMREDVIRRLSDDLPEMPEIRIARLVDEHELHPQVAEQIVSEWYDTFTGLVADGVNPSLAARTLTQTFPELRGRGLSPDDLDPQDISAVLRIATEGTISRQAIPDVLAAVIGGSTPEDALEDLGLVGLPDDELRSMADELVAERADFVRERGPSAVGPLMGEMMKRVAGRADGRRVSAILRDAVEQAIE
ncbi:MAG TPA: Glu-tRNA(Gln) amidotransferase subunit GatE, partial [Thermoplasmata archaeon]|nr:Glu-tRNA(Gln) amidotransferase subunit GatE [Thermoplasmata archaeon]